MKKIVVMLLATLVLGACNEPPVMDVQGIKTNLAAYQKKQVVIEGVVSNWTSPDPQLFGIADLTEAGQLRQFVVPVRFNGPKPKYSEKIRITGKLNMQTREFVASKVVQKP